jgi:hypothetical protein
MKITPQLLRNLAERIELEGDQCGSDMPVGETIFGWLVEFFATEMEDEASSLRTASWRPRK